MTRIDSRARRRVRLRTMAGIGLLVAYAGCGSDAQSALYRTVAIELRSAEARLFPQGGTTTPTCSFVVQVTGKSTCTTTTSCTIPINTSVLFQSTAFSTGGTIIRYFWSFGNG